LAPKIDLKAQTYEKIKVFYFGDYNNIGEKSTSLIYW
jgi:hypothetical protein